MSEIVSQVHSLAAAAVGVLPCADDIAGLRGSDSTELLTELSALRRLVDTSISLVAADIERRSARELGSASLARQAGVKSGAELVQRLTGSSLGDAKKAVRVGVLLGAAQGLAPVDSAGPGPRSLDVLAALGGAWDAPVAVAVRNGWLGAEHADRLRKGLGAPKDDGFVPRWREAALTLIGDCWAGELTPEDTGCAAKTLRACLDREWAQQNAAKLHEQRFLKRAVRGDGMVKYDLLLDPMTDAQVWTPIFRHLAPRLGGPRFLSQEEQARATGLELDSRSNEQLLADTFTGFLTAGVNSSSVLGHYTSTVNVAVTTKELKKAIGCPTQGLGWLEGKPEPVGGAHLVAGVLFDDTGQSLDATKAERTFSMRQRRAMSLRDGGCLWPGCTMPPGACESHHVNPWSARPENRKTETRDGVLLCRFHHLNLHNIGGRIERRGSTYRLHWPEHDPVELTPKHGVIAQLRAERETA